MRNTKIEKHLIEVFIEFEQKNQLFDLEISGITIWHPIRFMVYNEILRNQSNIGQAHTSFTNEKTLKKILIRMQRIPDLFTKNPFLFRVQKDVLIFNHNRRVMNEGHNICLYTDMLIDELKLSSLVVSEPILSIHRKHSKNKDIIYTDYINFLVAIKRRISKKNIITEKDRIKVTKLIDSINNEFGVNFSNLDLGNKILDVVLSYQLMYPYYEKLINIISPKVIIEVVSYSLARFIINDIAKKRKIPAIELQHGTMGKYHIAYNFAEKMYLPTFPDYIFTFGQYWNDTMRVPINDSKVKVVGWPYFEQKVNDNKKIYKKNGKKVVLFISQGTIGKHLSKAAVEVSGKIRNNYKFIYKLHPGEYARWRDEYPWLIGSDIEVIDNNEHDMHYYFAQTDIQVGVYSTALFEGLGYGLKTIIWKLHGYEYMNELLHNGLAILVDNSNEFICSLRVIKKEINYDVGYFWERNSNQNIIKEINEIIAKTT